MLDHVLYLLLYLISWIIEFPSKIRDLNDIVYSKIQSYISLRTMKVVQYCNHSAIKMISGMLNNQAQIRYTVKIL